MKKQTRTTKYWVHDERQDWVVTFTADAEQAPKAEGFRRVSPGQFERFAEAVRCKLNKTL